MLRLFPLAWLIIYASTFAQQTDIKILQSTSEGVVVEYTPRYLTPEKFTSNGNEFIRYHFADGKIAGPNIPGSPEMAVRSVLLKFPGTQNNPAVDPVETRNAANAIFAHGLNGRGQHFIAFGNFLDRDLLQKLKFRAELIDQ